MYIFKPSKSIGNYQHMFRLV